MLLCTRFIMRSCQMIKDTFGKIENFKGVWINVDTLEACREELKEVPEE